MVATTAGAAPEHPLFSLQPQKLPGFIIGTSQRFGTRLTITNESIAGIIMFKVRTNCPNVYYAMPAQGHVPPQQTLQVILGQLGRDDRPVRPRIQVVAIPVTAGSVFLGPVIAWATAEAQSVDSRVIDVPPPRVLAVAIECADTHEAEASEPTVRGLVGAGGSEAASFVGVRKARLSEYLDMDLEVSWEQSSCSRRTSA